MGSKRGDVGPSEIRSAIFLLLSFLLTCRVIHCTDGNDVEKNFDNEVPILKHTKHKPDSKVTVEPAKQSPEGEKDETDKKKSSASASIKDTDQNKIVPQTNKTVTEPHSKDSVTSANTNGTKEDEGRNAGEGGNADTQKPADKSGETDKSDQKIEADESKRKNETVGEADSKTESTDHDNPDDKDDSGPADISHNGVETKTNDKTAANNTVPDSSERDKKPDSDKSVDVVTDHTVLTANSISPSLPEADQSTKTESGCDPGPKKYFSTQKPNVITPDNGSNFSFFRLFILTSVVFVVLYVGYYYRHKIKRHFGNNGNEIYYHPLRTMQHNAVD